MKEASCMGTRATMFVLAAFVALGGASACATTGEGSTSSSRRNEITLEELEATSVDDVMEAIALLRPQWLRARPARTPADPNPVVGVVIDGRVNSTREDLAQISITDVARLQFLNAADATIRFGTGYGGGAIVLTTRGRLRGNPPAMP